MILDCEQSYHHMLQCKLVAVGNSLVIPVQIRLQLCRVAVHCIWLLYQLHSLLVELGSLWDCDIHSGLMCWVLTFKVWFCFDSLCIGRVLAESLWTVSRFLALLQVCMWCIVSVCTSVGDVKKSGLYSGVQSMNPLVWLADWDWLYVFDLCLLWSLGWHSGYFTDSVEVPYDFTDVALFVDCWALEPVFMCLWAPTEEAFRVVRICGLSRLYVLMFKRCSFWWTASGIEFMYLPLV